MKSTGKEDQLTQVLCISKENGWKQYNIWKFRKTKEIVAEEVVQQHNEMEDKLQIKVWDPGELSGGKTLDNYNTTKK